MTGILYYRVNSNYLAHYGVKGMHWGVWNAETKAKYGLDGSISKGAKREIQRLALTNASNTGGTVGGLVGAFTGNPLLAGGSAIAATAASYPIHNLKLRKQYKKGSDAIDKLVTKRGKDGKPIDKKERDFQRAKTLSTVSTIAANAAVVGVATTKGHALVSGLINGISSNVSNTTNPVTGLFPPDPNYHTHPEYIQVYNELRPKPHTHTGHTPSSSLSSQLNAALSQQLQNGSSNGLHQVPDIQVPVPHNPTWLEAFRK